MGICITWIPRHSGINGNEKADQEAFEAATSINTPLLNIITFADTKKKTYTKHGTNTRYLKTQ